MASYPSFDPNQLAVLDGTKLNKIDPGSAARTRASAAEQRATDHPPARLDVQDRHQLRLVQPGQRHEPEHRGLRAAAADAAETATSSINDNDEPCGTGRQDPIDHRVHPVLQHPVRQHRHAARRPAIRARPTKYGFNDPNLTIPLRGGRRPTSRWSPTRRSPPSTAIGQHDDTVTPLQEAMLAATVANGGKLMKPYLVQQVTGRRPVGGHQTQPQPSSASRSAPASPARSSR